VALSLFPQIIFRNNILLQACEACGFRRSTASNQSCTLRLLSRPFPHEKWLLLGRPCLQCLYFDYINESITAKSKHPLHRSIGTENSSLTVHCPLKLPLYVLVKLFASNSHPQPTYPRRIHTLTLTATQHYKCGCLIC
jgi:hypothetical protein